MAVPKTRLEFSEYCLRKLGKGVISINVSDDQVDDRIDEALAIFQQYHYDGSLRTYLKHQLTQEDVDNMFIEVPDDILSVVRIFDVGGVYNMSGNMFNIGYQFALNDIYGLREGGTLTNYVISRMHLENIHKTLSGSIPIRFNAIGNKVYFDMDRNRVHAGMFLCFEAHVKSTPENTPRIWESVWLQQYATAKIKYQWGSNLTKMAGMMLPGNVQFNGELILKDAEEEIRKLDEEVRDKLAVGAYDMIG